MTLATYHSFYSGYMEASILLKNERVCSAKTDSFFLEGSSNSNTKKLVQVNLFASSVYINQRVAEAAIAERVSDHANTAVTFSFILNGIGKMDPEQRSQQKKNIVVSCDDLRVGFVSNNTEIGSLLGPSLPCTVDAYSSDF
ncbi:conserved hypothetical protein [Ricinus communis]|uniref:Uncharacterized protein n=1 Tax=Ricinus communis TaxID=3988 RepID=B9T2W8_RICCO|nr:conserved hypothetical protein [Ricinus communis]